MNLKQAVTIENMRAASPRVLPFALKERKTAEQIARRVFARAEEMSAPIRHQTEKEWTDEWLQSKEFVLLEISAGAVAAPLRAPFDRSKVLEVVRCAAESVEPVIVDVNKKKIGTYAKGTYFPPVIVVDGQHRYHGSVMRGSERIRAWVGLEAAAMITSIQADHQLGSSELHSLIQKKLNEAHPNVADAPGAASIAYQPRPWIKEVYPLEDYFVYTHDDKTYKQSYKCDPKSRSLEFVGKPKEVVQKYVHASREVRLFRDSISPMERAMQIHGAAGSAGMGGAPSSSLGNGSGSPLPAPAVKAPAMKMKGGKKKKKMRGEGYFGYKKATTEQQQKTKGASGSEITDQLKGSGFYGYDAATDVQKGRMKAPKNSEMVAKLKGSATVRKIVTKFKAACASGYKGKMEAVAPPGMEHTVKGLKKHFPKGSASPFKLAWYLHDKKKGSGK